MSQRQGRRYHSRMTKGAEPVDRTGSGGEPLAELVHGASRRLRRETAAALEPLGITPHHARALRVVERDGPMRLGELAAALHVVPRSVTDVVDALEAKGWVRRSPDPGDRRASVVALTDEGRGQAAVAGRVRRSAGAEVFEGLSAKDRAELTRLLRALTESP